MPSFKHTRHGSGETNPPLTFLAVLLGSSPTWTCPPCRPETGERVRARIFDGAFGSHLLVALLPFRAGRKPWLPPHRSPSGQSAAIPPRDLDPLACLLP